MATEVVRDGNGAFLGFRTKETEPARPFIQPKPREVETREHDDIYVSRESGSRYIAVGQYYNEYMENGPPPEIVLGLEDARFVARAIRELIGDSYYE